jgi:uncharacterized HAD superfamily protein
MNRVIAVDIDEVLVPFLPALSRFYTRQTNIKVKMPRKYPYHYAPLFNISEEESSKLVRDFYETSFHANLRPIRGSKEMIQKLSENNTLIAVTGRQSYAREPTENLIKNHFRDSFSDIIYCDHFTANARSKAEICKEICAELLIDDNYDACKDCLELSIPAVNFTGWPLYPWCELSDISVQRWDDDFFNDYL